MSCIPVNVESLMLDTAHHNVGGLPEVSYLPSFGYVYISDHMLIMMTAYDERRELGLHTGIIVLAY